MHCLRIGFVVLVAAFIMVQLAGCNTLALTGPKKYKVDLVSTCQRIILDLDQTGEVSSYSYTKLDKVLNTWSDEFSEKASYTKALDVKKLIDDAYANPENSFHTYGAVRMKIDEIQQVLQTEVK